jgi:hypothetical protein
MSKALELIRLLIKGANEYEKETGNKNPTVYLSRNNLLVIEKSLNRLESIDNAEPSEALELVGYLQDHHLNAIPYYDWLNDIEKYILKAQKEHKALEILKKLFRNPDGYSMLALVNCEYPDTSFRIESTDDSWIHTKISKEEFDILKEVLGE